MEKKILVVSLNPAIDKIIFLPQLNKGGIHRISSEKMLKTAGGKGVNVARMCAQAGANTKSIGFAAGEAGKFIASDVESRGVEVDNVWLDGETRTNLNIIDEAAKSETEILEYGPSVTEHEIADFMSRFEISLPNASVVVLSGGVPQGCPVDIYAKLIKLAKSEGIPTILDASGEVLREGVKACPTVVKPNVRELSELAGRELRSEEEIIDSCKALINENNVQTFIVSRGDAGAILIEKNSDGILRVEKAKPKVQDVVNTLGCGDAMVAGIACSMAGIFKEGMLETGMAFAGSNAGHRGVGFVGKDEIYQHIK